MNVNMPSWEKGVTNISVCANKLHFIKSVQTVEVL